GRGDDVDGDGSGDGDRRAAALVAGGLGGLGRARRLAGLGRLGALGRGQVVVGLLVHVLAAAVLALRLRGALGGGLGDGADVGRAGGGERDRTPGGDAAGCAGLGPRVDDGEGEGDPDACGAAHLGVALGGGGGLHGL